MVMSGYSLSLEMPIIQICALADYQVLHGLVLRGGWLFIESTNVKPYVPKIYIYINIWT